MVYWKSYMAQIHLYDLSKPNLYWPNEKMFAGTIVRYKIIEKTARDAVYCLAQCHFSMSMRLFVYFIGFA